ncbi:hypothetical protein D3C79_1081090 [compost metagenome]
MGQHLTLEILMNVFPERHVLVIPQLRAGFHLPLSSTHLGLIALLAKGVHQQFKGRSRQLDGA